MDIDLPLLGLGTVFALVAASVVWLIARSSRAVDKQRENRAAKRMAQQPWDAQSADGRGNR